MGEVGDLSLVEPKTPQRRRTGSRATWLTRADREARGRLARVESPLADHALFAPTEFRPDPVELLERQAVTRVPELVPIRYGRMATSAFAFYRGAALVMASDLASTPSSGLRVQLCGDAHLSNFGMFASPERRLLFDLNDFDETLPGPFEWDVKRLAASFEVMGRGNGFKPKERRASVLAAAQAYREAMATFAGQTNLEVWYSRMDVDTVLEKFADQIDPKRLKKTQAAIAKAKTRDNLQAFSKLTTIVDGHPRIVADPPLIVPIEDLLPGDAAEAFFETLTGIIHDYRRTLSTDRRHLLGEFRAVHMARKVVGVGSVGTRAWIVLMEGIDGQDPLMLQAKEAQASVLEQFLGASEYNNHGQRVVAGQHLMQAASDIFLGWQRVNGIDGVDRDFYMRQLRDWKMSVPIEGALPKGAVLYARLCGWTLARAHARSGDRVAIAAYLGGKDTFDQAIADFAVAYADQTEQDYAKLLAAIDAGSVKAESGF